MNYPASPEAALLMGKGSDSGRAKAVPIEIPVAIQGLPGRDSSEAYDSFYEETRTVMVFPQGAVVRLSARTGAGQKLVVANQWMKKETLCRVVPGREGGAAGTHVTIEFTQPSPGFWGISFPSEAGPIVERSRGGGVAEELRSSAASGPGGVNPASRIPETTEVVPLADSIRDPHGSSRVASAPSLTAASKPVSKPQATPTPSAARPAFAGVLLGARTASPSRRRGAPSRFFLIAALVVLVVGGFASGFILPHLLYNTSATEANPLPATSSALAPASVAESPATPAPTAASSTASGSQKGDGNAAGSVPQPQPTVDKVVADAPKVETAAAEPVTRSRPRPAPVVGATMPLVPARPSLPSSAERVPSSSEGNAVPNLVAPAPSAQPLFPQLSAQPAPAPAKPQDKLVEPKLIAQYRLEYPPLARQNRVEGDVVIDAQIEANGQVGDMRVLSGNTLLRQAAMDALKHWKYEPAKRNGQPVAYRVTVAIRFRLQ